MDENLPCFLHMAKAVLGVGCHRQTNWNGVGWLESARLCKYTKSWQRAFNCSKKRYFTSWDKPTKSKHVYYCHAVVSLVKEHVSTFHTCHMYHTYHMFKVCYIQIDLPGAMDQDTNVSISELAYCRACCGPLPNWKWNWSSPQSRTRCNE